MERLTKALCEATVRREGSQPAGWYHLAASGYLPEEIALWSAAAYPACEVRSIIRRWADANRMPLPASCALTQAARSPRPAPIDWREAFQTRVMRTGLALTLTQPQLEFLCAVADRVLWDRGKYYQQTGAARPDSWLATGMSVAKRGLIVEASPEERRRPGRGHQWALSPAGEALVELLKVAGVFVVADEALERKGRTS